jgi:nucleotide-binding universal stress UspA family protein
MSPHDRVLVGIDGSEGGLAALRYAAAQALRLDLGLWLMHVWPEGLPPVGTAVDTYAGTHADTERRGRQLLDHHAELGRGWAPGVPISVSLVHGDRVGSLVRAANDARLTVLGDERRPILDRIASGSLLAAVASRAAGPVVAVPANWEVGTEKDGVVAAVKSCTGSAGLVHRAIEIAAEQRLPLTLLHAWRLPMIYDEYIAARVGEDSYRRRAEEQLQALVGSATGETGSDVPVRIVVRHAHPARAIVDASAAAHLVLLARRPHALLMGHLGGTGRAVLRESSCPVEVVPPAEAPAGLDGLVVEAEGEAIKGSENSPGVIT